MCEDELMFDSETAVTSHYLECKHDKVNNVIDFSDCSTDEFLPSYYSQTFSKYAIPDEVER